VWKKTRPFKGESDSDENPGKFNWEQLLTEGGLVYKILTK